MFLVRAQRVSWNAFVDAAVDSTLLFLWRKKKSPLERAAGRNELFEKVKKQNKQGGQEGGGAD